MVSENFGDGAMYGPPTWMIPDKCEFLTKNNRPDGVYFLVDYRTCPMVKQPESYGDIYNAVKYIYKNANKWGLDKHKISMEGKSGGSYQVLGASMLLA